MTQMITVDAIEHNIKKDNKWYDPTYNRETLLWSIVILVTEEALVTLTPT